MENEHQWGRKGRMNTRGKKSVGAVFKHKHMNIAKFQILDL